MKKYLFLMMLSILTVTKANAAEQVLWEGDYNVSWELSDGDEHREWKGLGQDDFAAMEVGQKLYFYFSVTGDTYHKYNFDNWSWQALPGHEAEHADNFGFSEDTKVEFELTQAIKDEIAANGFAIHGHGFHVTKVSKEVADNDTPADSEEVLWTGDFNVSWDLPEGSPNREWGGGEGQDITAHVVAGAKIFIYLTVVPEAEYHKCQFDNWDWKSLPGLEPVEFSEDTKVTIEVTADIAAAVQEKGFRLHGHGFHVTKVSVANANTTGIKNIYMANRKDKRCYNLNGQLVGSPAKGLFVIDGRKIIVR